MKGLRLVGVVAVLALGAGAASVDGARAGVLSCMDNPERVFAPWGDYSQYTLAPNGSLESGSMGWSLSGARVISQSNTLRSGSYSLSLPSGSSATSPAACVKLADPASRFFLRNTGASDGNSRSRSPTSRCSGCSRSTRRSGTCRRTGPGSRARSTGTCSRTSSERLRSTGSLSAQLRFRFTPTGRGASFEIDDLFVDPLLTI